MENGTATVAAEHYALDIETTGLDCRSDRVISAAIYSPTATVVMDDRDEVRLLGRLHSTLVELPPGLLVTWNGSVFDGPFLHRRAEANGMPAYAMFPLIEDESIVPKYEPQPGFRACGYHLAIPDVDGNVRGHVDVAYAWRQWAADHGVKWSLKPVAKAAGTNGVIEVDRTAVDRLSIPERLAYNLSDVVATWKLYAMGPR
jgi:DNA polymerase elongation subunit (family B)